LQTNLDVTYEELDKGTMVYLKKCTEGRVTINCKVTKVILGTKIFFFYFF